MTNQTLRAVAHIADGGLIITGDSGIIFRSVDSGKTWKKIASSTTYDINGIAINALGHGYFVGEHGLIGKTTDFGVTWPTVTDTSAFGYMASSNVTLHGVAISNGDSAVAIGDSGAVGITFNGITWAAKTPDSIYSPGTSSYIARTSFRAVFYRKDFRDLYILSESDLIGQFYKDSIIFTVFTERGGDPDGGDQYLTIRFDCGTILDSTAQMAGPLEEGWTLEPTVFFPQTGFFENFLFISIDSLGYGYAACTGGDFLKTTDNGFTWRLLVNDYLGANGETDIHLIDTNNAFAVGQNGAAYLTTDGGKTWSFYEIDPAVDRLHSIANPAPGSYVVCGDNGAILRSTDGRDSVWTPINNIPTTSYLEAVAFSTPEIGIAAGDNATIIRTTDQGLTWDNVPNVLSGKNTDYRQLVAFPSGTYYAVTDSTGLYYSTDNGQNWQSEQYVPQSISEGFYNERIGVIAESAWSSAIVDDTMRFAFTRDGFTTKPIEFTIPIISNNRMVFHFLDSNTFLCLGSDGFVVKVDMSQGGASVTDLSAPPTSPIVAFPNPSATESTTIAYNLEQPGEATIELYNILGERLQTLFVGSETSGTHSQQLKINPVLHGSFFIKVISGTEAQTIPVSFE